MPQEVISIVFDSLREKSKYIGQRREFSYVFKLSTVDVDTGDPVLTNEFRTYASDLPLDVRDAQFALTNLIEESPTYK